MLLLNSRSDKTGGCYPSTTAVVKYASV